MENNLKNLAIGLSAPSFELVANSNKKRSLEDYKGNILVLYFYPKDDTTACTLEAINFSKHKEQFDRLGAVILGVSKDGIQSHERFIAKYDLNFSLLSDKDSALAKKYGIWVEKSMFGKKYMGADRSTFLIDENGIIQYIWRDVKVQGHVEEVLSKIKELNDKK
jgi:peroxiredoxin Q/BCP